MYEHLKELSSNQLLVIMITEKELKRQNSELAKECFKILLEREGEQTIYNPLWIRWHNA